MRKFIVRVIPITTILLFILVMSSDIFLKHPFSGDDNVPESIQLIMNDVDNKKWEDAYNKIEILDNAWKKVVKRVQFSAERDEINNFDKNVARLRGAILVKDEAGAMMELSEAYEHWENVGK